jgi:type IV secretion system protein VirD4
VICIDLKGENVRVTARARAAKGKVWCLDPFGVSGQPLARYNPLDPASLDIAEDANTFADALVLTRRGNRAKPTGTRKPRPWSPG